MVVIRGGDDRLCTGRWVDALAAASGDRSVANVPGAHAFPWLYPDAWSIPLRELAARVG